MTCYCESLHCKQDHNKGGVDGLVACQQPTSGHKIMYVGDVCEGCYHDTPKVYRLPSKEDM